MAAHKLGSTKFHVNNFYGNSQSLTAAFYSRLGYEVSMREFPVCDLYEWKNII